MHPNEIKITADNVAVLMKLAATMSDAHLEALDEQILRQNAS